MALEVWHQVVGKETTCYVDIRRIRHLQERKQELEDIDNQKIAQ